MPSYRRNRWGNIFFLTLVTHQRRNLFTSASTRAMLHETIDKTLATRPWKMEAIVLLPGHLHMLWHLPDNDMDYSSRIAAIKKRFTRMYLAAGGTEGDSTKGRLRQRYRGIWQKRFWEHTIRDAKDFHMHVDYIHMNPVKHGFVKRPYDWPFSSFHRYVQLGWYEQDWCGRTDLPENVEYLE